MRATSLNSASNPTTSRFAEIAITVASLVAAGVVIMIRVRALQVPLERDEGEYAYAGMMMLKGYWPYEDFYNMKFPGTYVAYAFFMLIFGKTVTAIHLGALIMNIASAALVFLIGKQLGGKACGAAAMGIFLLLTISPELQGTSANSEHFVLPLSLGGLYLAFKMKHLFWSGVLLGLGVIMKQHGVMFLAAAGVFVCVETFRSTPSLKSRFQKIASFGAAALIPIALTVSVFALRGSLGEMWFYTVTYARDYVSLGNEWALQAAAGPVSRLWLGHTWLILLSGIGIMFSVFYPWRVRLFLVLLLVFSLGAASIGFYYRPHYFILMAPVVALLFGMVIQKVSEWRWKMDWGWVSLGLIAFVSLSGFIKHREYYFKVTPIQMSRELYGVTAFPEAVVIGEYIRSNSQPEHHIAVVGNEPEIPFYADRRSATGFMYVYPIWENHSYSWELLEKYKREVEHNDPEYLIYCHISIPEANPLILDLTSWYESTRDSLYVRVGFVQLTGHDVPETYWGASALSQEVRSGVSWMEICRKR